MPDWPVVVAAIVVLVAVAEVALRARPPVPDHDFRGADAYVIDGDTWSEEYFEEWRRAQFAFQWEPFAYWRSRPVAGPYINVGDDGLRVTVPSGTAGPGARRIFVFGGSTVWGAGVRDEATLPSLLAGALESESIDAVVVNHGQIGYVSTQEVIALLRILQAGDIPDLVVFYDGYNDVLSAMTEGRAGVTFQESRRRTEFNILHDAAALAGATFGALALTRSARRRRQSTFVARPDTARAVARTYAANHLAVCSLAAIFGFDAQFFWQPNIFQKGDLTAYEVAQRDSIAASRPVFEEATELVGQWSARTGNGVVVLDDVFASSSRPYFLDWAHLSESGNRLVAGRVMEHLRAKCANPPATAT